MTLLQTLVFTLVAPGTIAGLIPYWLLGSKLSLFSIPIGLHPLGAVLFAVGVAIYAWCAWDFTFVGRGTPNPANPPRELVTSGLYGYTRNPMYVGVISVVLGEALWFGSGTLLLYSLVVFMAFHLRVLLYEEPTLQKQFGQRFADYRRRVPRWIIWK